MLALIYIGLAICVGDFLCRRFYRFVSVAHRCAAAILVGLLVSSWFTYLAGLAFWWTSRPLLWGNLLFFVAAVSLLTWPKWKSKLVKPRDAGTNVSQATTLYFPRAEGSGMGDWLFIAGYVLLVSWMMFASFNSEGSKLKISNSQYSDFGPNTAIIQSFAVGHNFPTEYPHFSGDRIRYHFLFYFQAGNLEFLGLDPVWSLNLMSIGTLVAMLILVMALGEVVFNSRTVGRVGSFLFFFFGSLAYVPFLQKQPSIRAAIQAIRQRGEFLPTIFPYRGEAWGTWSQVTYLNQRHFASAIGILLLVLVFLVIHYRTLPVKQTKAPTSLNPVTSDPHAVLRCRSEQELWRRRRHRGDGASVAPPQHRAMLSDENRLLAIGLPVHVPFPSVVLEHDRVVADRLHVLGQEGDLPATPRRVNHEVRHGEPRGPPAQRPNDLQALFDGRTEVLRARHLVAHVDVIRPHPRGEELLHQPLHHLGIVVHAPQEHRLAAERHAGVGEAAERRHRGGRELVGVIEVGVDVERVVLLQDAAQLRRDPLGEMTRHPAADPDDLEVRDGAQALAKLVDAPIGKEQRISARHDHVADLDVLLEVAERRLELGQGDFFGVTHLATAGAEAAIRGAHRRHEEQRTVGVAVGDVRHGRVGVLGQRVHQAVVYLELLQVGHVLPPNGVARGLDEVHHRGRDPELEILRRPSQPLEVGKVFGAELGDERVERGDALLTQ